MSARAEVSVECWGGTYTFRLPIKWLVELQEKTGHGPESLFRRAFNAEWRVQEMLEGIRLGLIGGGMSPAEAARTVNLYVVDQPYFSNLPVWQAVIGAACVGAIGEESPGKTGPDEEADASDLTVVSTSDGSTEPGPQSA